jgi:hypothetical protein
MKSGYIGWFNIKFLYFLRMNGDWCLGNRVILWFNISFGRERVVLLTKPSMFGKFVVHAWRFERRTFYIGSWRAKLILAPLDMPKWVWPFMNRYRMFFVQTSTLPPRMHHKLTKHGRFCKQNNQLPTKTHVESKDNSIIY